MALTAHLNSKGFYYFEGYSQQIPAQEIDLTMLAGKGKINAMEIGFNAGHSADIFLRSNPDLLLTSFDLGDHTYVLEAKKYIDTTYPNRHTLILGDSRMSVPKFIRDLNNSCYFDLIFIDGGHSYEIASEDMKNCLKLSHHATIIAMDDTVNETDLSAVWTEGPTKVWAEQISNGEICQVFNYKVYEYGRGLSWGNTKINGR